MQLLISVILVTIYWGVMFYMKEMLEKNYKRVRPRKLEINSVTLSILATLILFVPFLNVIFIAYFLYVASDVYDSTVKKLIETGEIEER